ncbi:MAG: hypothetical protein AMXMBFR84_26360 [Candidatus Hydrogenedentota bacterium]
MGIQILSFKASRFAGLGDYEIGSLDQNVFVLGMNGDGKSSLLMAIEQLYAGRCYDRLRRAIPFGELVEDGKGKCELSSHFKIDDRHYALSADIQSGKATYKLTNATGKTKTFGSDSVADRIAELLGVDPAFYEACISPCTVLLGKTSDTLARLTGTIDQEALAKFCAARFDWLKTYAAEQELILSSVAGLDAIGKAAYTQRTVSNKTVKDLQAELMPIRDAEFPLDGERRMTADERPDVQAFITELQEGLNRLNQELGAAQAYQDRGVQTESADELNKDLADAERRLSNAADRKQVTKTRLEILRNRLKTLEGRRGSLPTQIAEIEARIAEANRDLEAGGVCLMCNRPLESTEIAQKQAQARRAIEHETPELEKLKALLAEPESEIAKVERELESTEAEKEVAEGDWYAASTDIASLKARITALNGCTAPKRSVEAIEAEIADVQASIERGQEKLNSLDTAIKADALSQRITVETEIQCNLDWAVKCFRDRTYQNREIEKSLQKFRDACNAVLTPFGYSLSVRNDGKDMGVYLTSPNGRTAPMSRVSNGELILAQLAVTRAFDAGPALLDGIEQLDNVNRPKFRDLMQGGSHSLIAAAAWGNEEIEQPDTRAWTEGLGIDVRWFQDGKTAPHEAVA